MLFGGENVPGEDGANREPKIVPAQLRTLAEGDYVAKAEPVLLVGEAGKGKTQLATGLCVATCRQRRRVRFATAAASVNELAEAAHANQLSRALGRWERLDLICIDELGYVPLAETARELMFQVDCRPGGESGGNRGHEPAVLRMVAGHPQPAAVQGTDRSIDGPGAHHHRRCRLYRFRRTTAQRKASKA